MAIFDGIKRQLRSVIEWQNPHQGANFDDDTLKQASRSAALAVKAQVADAAVPDYARPYNGAARNENGGTGMGLDTAKKNAMLDAL
ncbi:MAG: hypothetical protein EPN89_08325 [Methylovulum sp.]|jgi:hypothetical protein|nr:MAG: hypothetical protein EPN89_08325 [Methylovulum sp.]